MTACLLLDLDTELTPDAAIATLKKIRGPGAVQSVKVFCLSVLEMVICKKYCVTNYSHGSKFNLYKLKWPYIRLFTFSAIQLHK